MEPLGQSCGIQGAVKAVLRRVIVIGVLSGLAAAGPLPAEAKATDFGAWVSAPNLHEGHVAHTATLLKDGRVLIAGGTDVHGVATAGCELFDPKANRWIRASNMIHARAAHAATLLADGNVLVIGGQTGLSIFPLQGLASGENYHPNSNSLTAAAAMPLTRRRDPSILLRGGPVRGVRGAERAP